MTSSPSQKKVLGFRDVALITFISNFGVRWLAVAAGIGASAISYWLLGAVLFFLPLVFVAAKLSRLYPEEGGIYKWTEHALGKRSAFIVAWLYWVNNIFYYPAVLIFLATNFAYFLGKPQLANNHVYITACVLIAFWLIVIVSLFGLKASKYLVEYGGLLGTIIPTIALILLGVFLLLATGKSATSFSAGAALPSGHIFNKLSTLTIIMFAMAGVEVIPTFANAVRNPKRDLYNGLIIGSLLIFLFYALGTFAINVILTPAEVQNTSGLMQTFLVMGQKLHAPWFSRAMSFLLVFAELAAVTIWLIAPVTMFFKCTPKGILPNWLHKTNRHDSPANAILLMGLIISAITLITNALPSINNMYQVLVLMATILYFIPYLFLAAVYFKSLNKLPGSPLLNKLYVLGIAVSITLGILFSFEPPTNLKGYNLISYELELILGPLIFIYLGYFIYMRRSKSS
ncbi:MAG: amino acid transporter [Gammaproteobacteria bacterium CG11_big_fil_rev_8_21_14_0_20_46_22]|nr:MAG: amino acid transporter [Gammaproteobacteria bacterium CG12_big_fil_rev_8_21_14_0_65_46_12]PIR11153.1 MAG: amino acid transporter [Gammaproteobacteria bacterium CG11_big_fil_rev_8_21_14_0_20_46_22]